jgi:class 3 adenylate cyclase
MVVLVTRMMAVGVLVGTAVAVAPGVEVDTTTVPGDAVTLAARTVGD